MRALATSVAVHLLLVVLIALHSSRSALPESGAAVDSVAIAIVEPMVVDVLGGGGGGGPAASAEAASISDAPAAAAMPRANIPKHAPDAWQEVTVSMDQPRADAAAQAGDSDGNGNGSGNGNRNGNGNGKGTGNGNGDGTGSGNGRGVQIADDLRALKVPAPPTEATRVSKARPAKLIYPTRERDVEDEADLFVAHITVDTDGDVVGAHMVRTRPGARGDQAANAIWSFRYLPALDDDGRPIRSTFDQQFQIRR